MSALRCQSTHGPLRCQWVNGHPGTHGNGGESWIVSDATIAEADEMARAERERVDGGAYTSDEMVEDLNEWSMATAEQRSAAFSTLVAVVTADAYQRQDADLISRLRAIRNKRDGATS